jgi:diadenosine tetraphosphate (Ap4A) HIT family hydrolase
MSNKLKLLVFGSVGDNASAFVNKLKALNASQAGPFDAAFCVGACDGAILQEEVPIPVYLQTVTLETDTLEKLETAESQSSAADDKHKQHHHVLKLAANLFLLQDPNHLATTNPTAGIWSLVIADDKPALVVASCPPLIRVDSVTAKPLLDSVSHVSYRGCDLFLTHELPQGMERLDSLFDATNRSFDVADLALRARARYHIVPATTNTSNTTNSSVFVQSPPFAHLAATTNTISIDHVGRVIAIGPVLTPADAKSVGKKGKFVHALGLVPLLHMSSLELDAQKPATICPNPYTDESYASSTTTTMANGNKGGATFNVGLSEASARRILAEKKQSGLPSERWAQKRQAQEEPQEIDPTNTTLFVHGLHKDVTSQLQSSPTGDILVLQAFQRWNATKVRKPPGAVTSSFCFVEFDTHKAAFDCWQDLGGDITIEGVKLSVKWASHGTKKQRNTNDKTIRLTEDEAKDSSTIYFKVPGFNTTHADMERLGEAIRKWNEETLEEALADGGDKVTTARDEPALQVKSRVPETDKSYGFLDFASHAAASMALATLTGSTDGGQVVMDAAGRPEELKDAVVYLNWAKAKLETESNNVIIDWSGFTFERKHFPADARHDCWFCLASEGCEKHLITGVYDKCYAAMPKGPVHPGHILLIPVQHSSQGALNDVAVSEEMDELKARLRAHASAVYDMDLFVFERAIQTKGGYHTHLQCIPVQKKLGIKLELTMLAQAKKCGMLLREIKSDLKTSSVIANDEDCEGYFYAELPIVGDTFKRFVYKATTSGNATVKVPLQFGREVLAAVLAKPELAHWKSCVVDQEQEGQIASAFRESFSKY